MGAAEEATEKVAANKEAADKSIVDEATVKGAVVGAPGDSPAPGQVPSLVAGTKRAWLQVAPPRLPNDPIGVFGKLSLSCRCFFCKASF
jgi:hypothetical protein